VITWIIEQPSLLDAPGNGSVTGFAETTFEAKLTYLLTVVLFVRGWWCSAKQYDLVLARSRGGKLVTYGRMSWLELEKRTAMYLSNRSITAYLGAASLVFVLGTSSGLAGYKSALSTSGVGSVQASLGYLPSTTNQAVTPNNYTRPSAGVTTVGTWTAQANPPAGSPLVCTSTVSTVYLTGGYKAVARSYVTTGVTADNPELGQKLKDEHFQLIPSYCGASYNIASGDEIIDGQRYLVVLGNATGGTAAWFRGYIYDGTPSSREDIIANGNKIYEALVKGPFDFGDPESPDRCKAMKIPIDYAGPNLYLVSDGIAVSESALEFVNVPQSVTLGCSDPLVYPALLTSGGCGLVNVTYSPPANLLPPGVTLVTATAVDSANNIATVQFPVSRPFVTFTGFYSPISGTGGAYTAPLRVINAGNKIPIKFDTSFCGVTYQSPVPPNVTITKRNPNTGAIIGVPVDHQYFQWVSNQWHFNWNTLSTDKGYYRIEVVLGDGSPNPYAIVQLK
jgi:hypothetical protein